ncbi:Hpt domain-containing protein [Salidesulfovibrio onnuriiensis]|uniref:Hpt domain-containing protein n=1 Tax=Salidesulfovibrio onnuriiensis TaxID=2583823 RepID=UPI00164EF612|nr:Hpt domain-containing protein [Salidesulfovibrio onnuriiensis]
MINDPVLNVFVEETSERLGSIEAGLLRLEACGEDCDDALIHGIFRDAHSVKAGANLLKLKNIESLSHKLENILEMIRKGKMAPNDQAITVMLETVDKLRELVENITQSDSISIRLHEAMLNMVIQKAAEAREEA